VKVLYFVRQDCEACKNAREKVEFFIEKWGRSKMDRVSYDVGTEDGLIEAALRGVSDIPTIVLERDGDELARWTKKAPKSDDLRSSLEA